MGKLCALFKAKGLFPALLSMALLSIFTVAAANILVSVNPQSTGALAGANFTINVNISTTEKVYAADFTLYFDKTLMRALDATEGGFLRSDGANTYPIITINNSQGFVRISDTRFGTQSGVSGSGILASIVFNASASGTGGLTIQNLMLVDENIEEIAGAAISNGTVVIVQRIECNASSDCGTDGYINPPFCQGNDVFRTYRSHACINPGQPSASCSYADTLAFQQDCGDNSCGQWGANYCKGSGVYRNRSCNDRECLGGSCFDSQRAEEALVQDCGQQSCYGGSCASIACSSGSDCGIDGFTGHAFCQSNDTYQNYRTYSCSNPGTPASSCSSADTPALKQDCGTTTYDSWGLNYCDGNAIKHNRTAHIRGCLGGSCYLDDVIESAVVQACGTSQICQGGACLAVSCNTNTDCGADGFVGGRICVGNDVKQNYRTYACSRPGTPSSSCSFSDALTLVMTCAKNCLNGQCTGEYLWMVDTSGKKIYKLDPSNGSVLLSFPAPSKNPTGLTFDGANLWVADKSLKRVYKLNAWGIMINSFPIPVKDSLRGMAFDGKDLWISGTKMIYKISRNGTDFNDSMKGKFYGMTFDGSNIWAVDTKLKKIEKLDASGSVLSSIPIPKGSSSPFGLAYDGVSLWLSDSKKIYRLNPANGAVLSSFNAPAKTKPGDLAFE